MSYKWMPNYKIPDKENTHTHMHTCPLLGCGKRDKAGDVIPAEGIFLTVGVLYWNNNDIH